MHSRGGPRLMGSQPRPQLLERAASKVANFTAFDFVGTSWYILGDGYSRTLVTLPSHYRHITVTLPSQVQPILGDGYSRTLAAWLDNLEAKRGGMVTKYGRQFYEGFRACGHVSTRTAMSRAPVLRVRATRTGLLRAVRTRSAGQAACPGRGSLLYARRTRTRVGRTANNLPRAVAPQVLLRLRRGLCRQQRRRVHGRLLYLQGRQGHQGRVSASARPPLARPTAVPGREG